MSTYTPYQTGMTTGGSWSYIGSLSPNPDAPSTYDDSIDFEGFAAGIYTYRYTVTLDGETHTADVAIEWQGDGSAPVNDECDGAKFVSGIIDCPINATVNYNTAKQCVFGIAAPSDSGEAIPKSWALSGYGGDLWYRFIPPNCNVGYTMSVTTSGGGTISDANGVAMAVYFGNCDSLNDVTSGSSDSNSGDLSLTFSVPANNTNVYYVRIASVTSGTGSLSVECTNECVNTGSSVTLYSVAYPNDEDAALGGVGQCSAYRMSQINDYTATSPGGKALYISRIGSCNSYADDSAAQAAGIPLGGMYAISQVNNYTLPSPGGRLAVIRTDGGTVSTVKGPYESDSLAALGGVAIGEAYLAANGNVYGMPSGGGRTLIVRTS